MPNSYIIIHSFPAGEIEGRWRDFLARSKAPSHYNAPEFFLEPYWEGKQPFAVLATEGERITGVLTGIHEANEVISGLGVRPQIFVGEPEHPSPTLVALMEGLIEEAGAKPLLSVFSWEWLPLKPFIDHGFRPRALTGDVVLDLTRGTDQLFKDLDKKRRNNIRYATKHGVEIARATSIEEFRTYRKIYLGWCARKNLPPFPQEMEEKAFLECARSRHLYLARHEGTIIAGTIIRSYPGGMVEYGRNNSLPEHLNLKPNDLLLWNAISWACAGGFPVFSLGGAGNFHREFGGKLVPIYRYRLDRSLFRRYDRKEDFAAAGSRALRRLPAPIEKKVRRILKGDH